MPMPRRPALWAATAAAVLAILGHTAPAHARLDGYQQTGVASWYGSGFDGKPTADGGRYDPDDLTAAHRSLPFGTRVIVTDLKTGRSVDVEINDRGPFIDGRIIDLSRAAARRIGLTKKGLTRVRIEVFPPIPRPRETEVAEAEDYSAATGPGGPR